MFESRVNVPRVAAAIMALGLQQAAMSEGFRNPPAGASSLARSGGRIAQIDDPAAATQNPANMVEIPGVQFQAAPMFVHVQVEHSNGMGGTAETTDPWKVLPYAFVTGQIIENKLAAGLAITSPFGLSNEWEKEGRFADRNPATSWRYQAPYYTELMSLNVGPVLAYRVNDWLSIGGGPDFYWSRLTFRRFFPGVMLGLPEDPVFKAQGDDIAFGGNAAATIHLTDRQRLAFKYRSPFTMNYEGDLRIGDAAAAAAAPLGATSTSTFKSEIEFPTIVAVGYGIELTDTIRLETDAEWVEFSNFDELPLDVGNNAPLVPINSIPQDWEDTFTIGISGDWRFAESWTARGSYQFYESPVPEFTFSPTIPDSNQHAFTTGLNFSRGRHEAELAYAYIMYEGQEVRRNQVPQFLGDYDMVVHLISAAYTFSF